MSQLFSNREFYALLQSTTARYAAQRTAAFQVLWMMANTVPAQETEAVIHWAQRAAQIAKAEGNELDPLAHHKAAQLFYELP